MVEAGRYNPTEQRPPMGVVRENPRVKAAREAAERAGRERFLETQQAKEVTMRRSEDAAKTEAVQRLESQVQSAKAALQAAEGAASRQSDLSERKVYEARAEAKRLLMKELQRQLDQKKAA